MEPEMLEMQDYLPKSCSGNSGTFPYGCKERISSLSPSHPTVTVTTDIQNQGTVVYFAQRLLNLPVNLSVQPEPERTTERAHRAGPPAGPPAWVRAALQCRWPGSLPDPSRT